MFNKGKKILCLTAYDFQIAQMLAKAKIEMILVGDSYGMVVLGHKDTKSVTLPMLIEVAKEVRRGAPNSFIIFDMPYKSYDDKDEALKNAKKALLETKCDAVKIEGSQEIVGFLVKHGIKVMGHTGLKPQFVEKFAYQGKEEKEANLIIDEAIEIEKAGAFAIVLECIPENLAKRITEIVQIPTIGIGAGKHTDGQVRVTHDVLGLKGGKDYGYVESFADSNNSNSQNLNDFIKYMKS